MFGFSTTPQSSFNKGDENKGDGGMSNIKNYPKHNNKIIKAVRGMLEHRATWLYLLLDEARKRGINTEDFAKAAVMRCGCFQGYRLSLLSSGGSMAITRSYR
jgi:hypothetical protein